MTAHERRQQLIARQGVERRKALDPLPRGNGLLSNEYYRLQTPLATNAILAELDADLAGRAYSEYPRWAK